MSEATAEVKRGRPRKSIKDKAEEFLAAIDELEPEEHMRLNRAYNGRHGITIADLRSHVRAFVASA